MLVQATVGCPHNKCTFCMVYKQGPRFAVRKTEEIEADLLEASKIYGSKVRTLFLPAGNTIAMPTEALAKVCHKAHRIFPQLERITVYGSSQYIHHKGLDGLKRLAEAGLSRIHVGLESGDDAVLKRIRKGTCRAQQIEAGQWVVAAGMELSVYVILGIGGQRHWQQHARNTATALNAINPHFIRLRTFVPKIHTPLLADMQQGRFCMQGPHEVLAETAMLIRHLEVTTQLVSDHYTNYINLEGRFPAARQRILNQIAQSQQQPKSAFRPFFIGNQ